MMSGDFHPMTLEERLLRVLYEAPASVSACVAEALRSHSDSDGDEVRRVLSDLQDRQCIGAQSDSGRYRITPVGSELLATLAESRERRVEAVRT
jgi:DNA-binding IclR family transcriptional regulator